VRYGNVMYSRGSVIPLFVEQIGGGRPLTITHPEMTRLLLPLAEAVDLVVFAMQHGNQGDIFVRKAAAATVGDLAQAMPNIFSAAQDREIVGIRAGEKMHEVLITAEEFARAEDFGDYYRVACSHGRDYDAFFTRGDQWAEFARSGYTSENAPRLSIPEIERLLLRVPEIRTAVEACAEKTERRRRAA
jgi:UDP-glucose 4-epimerase